jgi:hypothetical protein
MQPLAALWKKLQERHQNALMERGEMPIENCREALDDA